MVGLAKCVVGRWVQDMGCIVCMYVLYVHSCSWTLASRHFASGLETVPLGDAGGTTGEAVKPGGREREAHSSSLDLALGRVDGHCQSVRSDDCARAVSFAATRRVRGSGKAATGRVDWTVLTARNRRLEQGSGGWAVTQTGSCSGAGRGPRPRPWASNHGMESFRRRLENSDSVGRDRGGTAKTGGPALRGQDGGQDCRQTGIGRDTADRTHGRYMYPA